MASPPTNLSPAQLKANQGPGIIAGNIVVAVAAVVAVGLRIWSRKIKNLPFGIDDWLIIAALPFGLAMCAVTSLSVHFGLGRHLLAVPLEDLPHEAKAFFSTELLWAASIPFVKISILALYVRIFGGLTYIRRMAWALSIFTIAWAVMVILVVSLQCIPLEALWNPHLKGRCINFAAFSIAGSVPDVVVDFIMLFLPMPAVWKLQKALAERISLMAIFALGSLVCVISLVRLIELIKNATLDVTWFTGEVSVWSTAEPCLGIVCACLPTMTPLLRKWKILKTQNTGGGHNYYDSYGRAANDVSGNSKVKHSDIHSTLRSIDSEDSSTRILRGNPFGASAGKSRSPMRDFPTAGHQPGEENVYALTTIDVERHHPPRR